MTNQLALYEQARRKIAARDHAITDLINHPTNPLTNKDLAGLIERRPEVYARYAGYLGKLKD